jgi:hypothetical protein
MILPMLVQMTERIQWYDQTLGEWVECGWDYGEHEHANRWVFDPNVNCLVMPTHNFD